MSTVIIAPRVPTKIGAVADTTTPVVFGAPPMSVTYRGELTLTSVGGGVTTPTWTLVCSIDNGATWFTLQPSSTGSVAPGVFGGGDVAVTAVNQYNISGLAGALFKFGLTAGTGITSMSIWGWIG